MCVVPGGVPTPSENSVDQTMSLGGLWLECAGEDSRCVPGPTSSKVQRYSTDHGRRDRTLPSLRSVSKDPHHHRFPRVHRGSVPRDVGVQRCRLHRLRRSMYTHRLLVRPRRLFEKWESQVPLDPTRPSGTPKEKGRVPRDGTPKVIGPETQDVSLKSLGSTGVGVGLCLS